MNINKKKENDREEENSVIIDSNVKNETGEMLECSPL